MPKKWPGKIIGWWYLPTNFANDRLYIKCPYFELELAFYGQHIDIRKLFVSPKHLRRGIGTQIIKRLKQEAGTQSTLSALTVLNSGRAFWEAQDFTGNGTDMYWRAPRY